VWVSAGVAIAFLAGAAYLAWQVKRDAKARPFAESIAELERDVAALKTRE
jgi:uncharacterized membrane protein YqjE